jgi:hypothetical protein
MSDNDRRSEIGNQGHQDGENNKYSPPSGTNILDTIQDSTMGTDNQKQSDADRETYDRNWSEGYKNR